MNKYPTTNWRAAEAAGLKAARVLDMRVEEHRSGEVFFIQELVETEDGAQRWWYRRGGVNGRTHRPFTEKHRTRAEAEASIDFWKMDQAAWSAKAILRAEGDTLVDLPLRLRVIWESTPLADRSAMTGEHLAEIYRRSVPTCAQALELLRAACVEPLPSAENLRSEYEWRGRRDATDLVVWWHEEIARRAEREAAADLRRRKIIEREERRWRQDEMLLTMAAERAAEEGIEPPDRSAMSLVGPSAKGGGWEQTDPDVVLDRIAEQLAELPWLRHICFEMGGWLRLFVCTDGEAWSEWGRYERDQRKRDIAARAEICDAFGPEFDSTDHWGSVRGRLLRLVKYANLDLLHREDVQAALSRAREEGKELAVFGHVAFQWVDGEWRQREVVRRDGQGTRRGSRLWIEGPIVSRNHGRIVVLPYVKSDGTRVEGYTRNPPYEGDAEPRAEPKLIPFAVYEAKGRDDVWVHTGEAVVTDEEMKAVPAGSGQGR